MDYIRRCTGIERTGSAKIWNDVPDRCHGPMGTGAGLHNRQGSPYQPGELAGLLPISRCFHGRLALQRFPLGQAPTGALNAGSQNWCTAGKLCVSLALAANLRQLATAGAAPADAARALAFVVHFVGDMHQPLHEEDDGDLGGNNVLISPAADSGVKAKKLHELWDTPLVATAMGSELDAATKMLQARADGQAPIQFTTVDALISAIDSWAEDAHALAIPAYALLNVPVGAGAVSGILVSKTYVKEESDVVGSQLALAAIRLRAALNVTLTWSPPVDMNH